MIEVIKDEMEKIVSTLTGIFISTLFGSSLAFKLTELFSTSYAIDFLIELFSKVTIAVVSGVATYLVLYVVKKRLKHKE